MTRLIAGLTLSCMTLVAAAAALAGTPDDGKGRFAMSPVEGGYLRLDKETGAVSHCALKSQHWLCEPVEDHTRSADSRLNQLETENRALKDRVKALQESLETGKSADADPAPLPPAKMQLPSEEDVDKALDYAERLFRKFRDRIQRIEKSEPPADGKKSSGAL